MSDLGSLSQCLIGSDAETLGRARRIHRQALVISTSLEASVLAALVLWPLLSPGVLSREFVFTPAPPLHGAPTSQPAPRPADLHPTPRPPDAGAQPVYQPPVIPPHAGTTPDAEPPSVGNESTQVGLQQGIPNGNDDGAAIDSVQLNNAGRKNPPLKISEGVMQGLLLQRVQPAYPQLALTMRLSGTVRLHAIIGTDGWVRQIEVVSGNPIFIPSTLAAIRLWRYQPTRLSGAPVEVETYITVEFVLR